MNDVQIAASLRAKAPGVLAELFDAYGDRLFRYCWFMLRQRDIAHIALCDTMVVAEAHIGQLANPDLLGPWLYSLARAECRRRRSVPPSRADEPPARPGQRDADSRLIAWNAATSLAPDDLEALDLACRHDIDLPLVLGVSAGEAQALVDRATQSLERALAAEILVSRGGRGCPDWAEVLSGWTGTMTHQTRERVLGHAAGCAACGPAVPRNVSAARVFALLPAPVLSPQGRAEVLGFFAGHRPSAHQDLAVNQAPAPAEPGVPVAPQPRLRLRLTRAKWILVAAGAVAAAAAIASVFGLAGAGGKPVADQMITPAADQMITPAAGPVLASPAGRAGAAGVSARRPAVTPSSRPSLTGTTIGNGEAIAAAVTKPLTSPGTPAQTSAAAEPPGSGSASSLTPAVPAPAGTLTVSPGSLALGAGSTGSIVLTAVGGPVSWSASSSSAQVTLSSEDGTVQAGQSVTLEVTVSRGAQGGSAVVSVEPPASAPQAVEVSWAPLPGNPRPTPSVPDPSPTAPSPSPSPSASASASASTTASPSASASAS